MRPNMLNILKMFIPISRFVWTFKLLIIRCIYSDGREKYIVKIITELSSLDWLVSHLSALNWVSSRRQNLRFQFTSSRARWLRPDGRTRRLKGRREAETTRYEDDSDTQRPILQGSVDLWSMKSKWQPSSITELNCQMTRHPFRRK